MYIYIYIHIEFRSIYDNICVHSPSNGWGLNPRRLLIAKHLVGSIVCTTLFVEYIVFHAAHNYTALQLEMPLIFENEEKNEKSTLT